MCRYLDRDGLQPRRRAVLADLHGVVVGAGDGGNLALYPDAAERVVAVEPEPRLRATLEAIAVLGADGRPGRRGCGGVPAGADG